MYVCLLHPSVDLLCIIDILITSGSVKIIVNPSVRLMSNYPNISKLITMNYHNIVLEVEPYNILR